MEVVLIYALSEFRTTTFTFTFVQRYSIQEVILLTINNVMSLIILYAACQGGLCSVHWRVLTCD